MSFDQISEAFGYTFMRNALIGGVLISLCAALLGVCLVLRRFSMIGDGLSHVGFGAIAVAAAAGVAPLKAAVPIVIIAAVCLLRINESGRINGDSAIAVISTGSLAVGVIAASLSGSNVDLNNYMFGSILAMKTSYVVISAVLTAVVLFMYLLLYNRIFAMTFDESFAKAIGQKTKIYTTVIAVLTAVTVVVGMQMMGALLMSSFIIFPALIAMRLCRSFKSTVAVSAAISVVTFTLGLFVSFYMNTPAGATVVAVDLVLFIAAGLILRLRRA